MLGCAVFIKVISLHCFLSSIHQNKLHTVYPTRSGISANNSGGMNSNAIGTDNVDDGWADVSKKKKDLTKKKTPKKHNPYIEVIDPVGTDSNDNSATRRGAYEPFMVLLVGLPGSGKSTFAQSLVASMPNKFCRINQDELKTRPKCERRLKQVLSVLPSLPSQSESKQQQRLCPIIDRCNFDTMQRSTWYRLAKEAAGQGSLPIPPKTTKASVDPNEIGAEAAIETELALLPLTTTSSGIPVDVVVLDLPYEECLRRCGMRKGHPTIKSPQQAAGILKQLRKQWSPPHHSKNGGEKSSYRSLTIVRTDRERKECMLRILKQAF
jgi:predicted kinase